MALELRATGRDRFVRWRLFSGQIQIQHSIARTFLVGRHPELPLRGGAVYPAHRMSLFDARRYRLGGNAIAK
ncbi:MAG: hypothetical protein QOI34_885 [Verrucomicrobiota bacterium]